MAEWSIAAVLKTVEANYLQGFESLSLRIFYVIPPHNQGAETTRMVL